MPEPSHFLLPFSSKASLDRGQGSHQVGSLCCRLQPAAPLSAMSVELLRSPVLRVQMKETLMCECVSVFLSPSMLVLHQHLQASPRMPRLLDLLLGLEPRIMSLPCGFPGLPPIVHPLLASARQINTQKALSTALGAAKCRGYFEVLQGL